ncbi:MAG: hypothetical protein J6X49_07995 [Victivallales bacterium]|nr:hypothetical protein [Victivallales bacterium]
MEMQPEWIGRQAQCPYCKELFIVQGAMNPMQYQAPNPQNAYNQGQQFYPQNSNPQNRFWHWILECFDGSREYIGIALHVGNSHPINSCLYKKIA